MAIVVSAGALSPLNSHPTTAETAVCDGSDSHRPKNKRTFAQTLRHAAAIAAPWLPFFVILGVAIYSWYAFAIMLCFQTLLSDPAFGGETTRAVLYLVFGTVLVLLATSHLVAAALVRPGSPLDYRRVRVLSQAASDHGHDRTRPDGSMSANDISRPDGSGSRDAIPLPISHSQNYEFFVVDEKRKRIVRVSRDRYCAICSVAKPPRTHHCSTCNACVLKMDHHCPWINNCVGVHNYKLFLLALLWALACAGFYFGAMLQFLITLPVQPDGSTNFCGIYVNFIIVAAISLVGGAAALVLFAYHVRLLLLNRTTIEQLDRPDAIEAALEKHPSRRDAARAVDAYNLGPWRNAQQVLGKCPLLWLLPFTTGTDSTGVVFQKRS